jgi:hypothetical protein
MENSTIQLGSIVVRPVVAKQCFWAHLAFWPVSGNSGGKPWLLGGGAGRFQRAKSLGPVGKEARQDTGVEESRLEELGRSGAHQRGYPRWRSSSGEEWC